MQKKDYTLKEENQKVKEAEENIFNLSKYGKDLLLLINILKDYMKRKVSNFKDGPSYYSCCYCLCCTSS